MAPVRDRTNSCRNDGITLRAVAPSRSGAVGHLAPAEDLEFLLGGDRLEALTGALYRALVAGHEGGADGVLVGAGQLEPELTGDLTEEPVGDLEQDAGTVTGVGLGADGAPVLEVAQGLDGLGHDVVARLAGHGRHERHTAGVVLVETVPESLGRGECLHGEPFRVVDTANGPQERDAGVSFVHGARDDVGPSREEIVPQGADRAETPHRTRP